MRIDLLLVRLRFAKSRAVARQWAEEGHMRCNRIRVTCGSHCVSAGDVLTFPLGSNVRVIEIVALPGRRGPAREAATHYRNLDGTDSIAIAGCKSRSTRSEHEGQMLP